MQLVTTAVIRAHDQLTPALTRMAAQVLSANRAVQSSAVNTGRNVARGMTAGAASAFGVGAVVEKAHEFNKHIFGIGAGQIFDKEGGTQVEIAMKEMEELSKISLDMGRNMKFSSTRIAELGEVLIKAGIKDSDVFGGTLKDIMEAGVSLSKADMETPAKNIADFLHTLTVIQKPKSGQSAGEFIREQSDMILLAANSTKLSVGSIMEGMKQFQTIGAGMGLGTDEMLAALMGGAQRGFNASELGTALKSDMVRAVKPTAEGQSAIGSVFERLNQDRRKKGQKDINLSDFAQMEAIDPTRALGLLNRANAGVVTGKFGADIKKQLADAQSSGITMSDAFIDKITNQIAKKRGMTDAESRAQVRNSVVNSVGSPTGGFKFFDLLKTLVEGGATDAQIAAIFEGRQLARNKAFLGLFKTEEGKASEYQQTLQKLRRVTGEGLKSVETLWSTSAFGNVEAMKASFERLFIVIANTPVVQSALNTIERFLDALGRIDGRAANVAATLGLIGLAAVPAAFLLRGLLSPLGAIGGVAVLMGADLEKAKMFMDGFSSSFTPLMNELKVSPQMAELQQSLRDLFGGESSAIALGASAATGLVAVMRNLVDALNGVRDFLATLGLVEERKKPKLDEPWKQDGTKDGIAPYMKWSDQEMGWVDTRTRTEQGIDSVKSGWNTAETAWNKVLDFFHGENRSGREGAEAQKGAADRLTDAAGALERAAGSFSRPLVNSGGAAAPAPTNANPQGYGGR